MLDFLLKIVKDVIACCLLTSRCFVAESEVSVNDDVAVTCDKEVSKRM